jgi:hypothetical protein
MEQTQRKKLSHLVLGVFIAAVFLVGCATTKIKPEPFAEFSTSIQELRSGADKALELNVEQNRQYFINLTAKASFDPNGAEDIMNLMIQKGDSANPFSWKMDKTPLFMISQRFRSGVYSLNTSLVTYAELLKNLASSDLVSKKYFDTMANDLNENLNDTAKQLEISVEGKDLAIFSAAATAAAHAYIENRRQGLLRKAMEKNQENIAAIANHLQEAIGIAARNLRKEYDRRGKLLAVQLVPSSGGNLSVRRKRVKEFIALNEKFVARLSALEILSNSYGSLPNAHIELIRALEQPGLSLSAIRELYENGKHLYDLYKKLAPSETSKQ